MDGLPKWLLPAALCAAAPSLGFAAPLDGPGGGAFRADASVRVGCTSPAPPNSLLPDDRVIVFQVESVPAVGNWIFENVVSGFTGTGYFRRSGPDFFGSPGVDTLTYTFYVAEAGEYRLRIRNYHDHPDSTLENDCWVKIDTHPWEKIFSGEINFWSWSTKQDPGGLNAKYTLAAGQHTIRISGRSSGYHMDRFHLFKAGVFGEATSFPANDSAYSRPVLGQNFTVKIDDPTNQAGLTPNQTVTAWFASTAGGCGIVVPGVGELLIGPVPAPIQLTAAQVWTGPGTPNKHTVAIPNSAVLCGQTIGTQGLFVDLLTTQLVLTNALDVSFGDF